MAEVWGRVPVDGVQARLPAEPVRSSTHTAWSGLCAAVHTVHLQCSVTMCALSLWDFSQGSPFAVAALGHRCTLMVDQLGIFTAFSAIHQEMGARDFSQRSHVFIWVARRRRVLCARGSVKENRSRSIPHIFSHLFLVKYRSSAAYFLPYGCAVGSNLNRGK